jgi:AcrR family transcriptional regulator
MRAIAAEAGVDAALIHHYFENKQQLFLATIALPLGLPRMLETVAAGDRSGLGERLVRTVLGVWDSELQPSLVAAEEADRRAGLVASQILGLVIGRYVLRLPILANRQTDDLIAEVGPTVQRYVDGRT